MSDIIKELRENKYVEQGSAHSIWDLFKRAADEIESDSYYIRELEKRIEYLENRHT